MSGVCAVAAFVFLLLTPASVGDAEFSNENSGRAASAATVGAAAADAVIADLRQLQQKMLEGDGLDGKRVVLCKTIAGLGNRIQGIMSCLALAVATRRGLVVQWDLEVATTPPHANGLMPCRLEDALAFPAGIDLNVSRAFQDPKEMRNKVVEAYVSQMELTSGIRPTWGDLLLCTNLTYMLKDTPVLSIPAWRWMPEILSNTAYRATLERLFGAENSRGRLLDPPSFYRTVAPVFVRPAHALLVAAAALRAYWPEHSKAIGLQVRLGLATDNRDEAEHFFTPGYMWRSWLRCAYTVIGQQQPTDRDSNTRNTDDAEVWFIAADSTHVKVEMMIQMSREEGALVAAHNLELVTTDEQRALLSADSVGMKRAQSNVHSRGGLRQIAATGHAWLDDMLLPVVVDFASGTRLVFFGRDASRVGCEDVKTAMLEMHVLSWSHVLVASHLSTFAALAAASVAEDGIHYINRDGDCFPALSLEPLSDAGDLFRDSASCFSERHVLQHSWTRPRRRSVRRRPS
jgi:hypothetical protein